MLTRKDSKASVQAAHVTETGTTSSSTATSFTASFSTTSSALGLASSALALALLTIYSSPTSSLNASLNNKILHTTSLSSIAYNLTAGNLQYPMYYQTEDNFIRELAKNSSANSLRRRSCELVYRLLGWRQKESSAESFSYGAGAEIICDYYER